MQQQLFWTFATLAVASSAVLVSSEMAFKKVEVVQ